MASAETDKTARARRRGEGAVMHNSAMIERGPKAALFSAPQKAYTKLLLSSVPKMDPDWLNRLLTARGEHA